MHRIHRIHRIKTNSLKSHGFLFLKQQGDFDLSLLSPLTTVALILVYQPLSALIRG
jgi:hypothetical protein